MMHRHFQNKNPDRKVNGPVFACGKDTRTLRPASGLVDLRVGYVHRHSVAQGARNRLKFKDAISRGKKKGIPKGIPFFFETC